MILLRTEEKGITAEREKPRHQSLPRIESAVKLGGA
jgi:hypothetical protein